MYRVYWTAPDGVACSEDYLDMIAALTETNRLRALGRQYVTMVGENVNQVGQLGATGVESGLLPDGQEYTWSKRR